MKKQFLYRLSLGVSLLAGAAYLACLALNVDPATGFLRAGSPLPWYVVFALCAVLALCAGWAVPLRAPAGGKAAGPAPLWAAMGAASVLQGAAVAVRAIAGTDLPDAAHNTPLFTVLIQGGGVLCGLLYLLWGAFCALAAVRLRTGRALPGSLLGLGIAGSAAVYVYVILRFIVPPASWQRLLITADPLGALCVLLLCAALLRALFLPQSPAAARNLARMGLLAFAFGTCLALPQGIWQLAAGNAGWDALAAGIFCGVAGLQGAVCAGRAFRVQPVQGTQSGASADAPENTP